MWQPGPQTGSEAPFWTKFVATYVLLTGVQGLNCAPEVLSPCARDGFVGGTAGRQVVVELSAMTVAFIRRPWPVVRKEARPSATAMLLLDF